MGILHKPEEKENPRPCPFCGEDAFKERSFYTMFSQFIYWCGNTKCRLGKSKVRFWFTEWQGPDNDK